MGNSGFPTVLTVTPGTFPTNQEIFSSAFLSISSIQGDGNNPNIVTVTTSADHNLTVGDTITISGVTTQTDYNLDIGVTVVGITDNVTFTYSTTNHTENTEGTDGNVNVLNPYIQFKNEVE